MKTFQPNRLPGLDVLSVVAEWSLVKWYLTGDAEWWIADESILFRDEHLRTSMPLAVTDPAEAWELFAERGMIPATWIGDERRWYVREPFEHCNAGHREDFAVATGPDTTDLCCVCAADPSFQDRRAAKAHPPTMATAVALARAASGMTTAEELAREAAARLGQLQPARVVWWTVRQKTWLPERVDYRISRANQTLWTKTSERTGTVPSVRNVFDAQATPAGRLCQDDQRELIEWRHQLNSEPNPWEPVVAIWELGYALVDITPEAIVLACAYGDGDE